MGKCFNKCIFIGYIGTEIELKQTPEGKSVCDFSLGVTRDYKNKEGKYDADFFRCVTWGTTAEFVGKYLHKGNLVCVEGSFYTDKYEDRDTGHTRVAYKLSVSSVRSLESKNASGNTNNNNYSNAESVPSFTPPPPAFENARDDDLPF